MFEKMCWGVKSKERVWLRKLEQLTEALTLSECRACDKPPKGFRKRQGMV